MSLRSPTENENDNASHLESFGYAQDKLRERSFSTPFSKERTKDSVNNLTSEIRTIIVEVFAARANFPVVI